MASKSGASQAEPVEDDVTSWADRARARLRVIDPADYGIWRQTYEAGLQEAYRRKDFDGLTSFALFGAVHMRVQRLFPESIDQINFAITMARGNADALVYMLSARAAFEVMRGDHPAAHRTLLEAKRNLAKTRTARSRLAYESYRASIDCRMLESRTSDELMSSVPECEALGFDWLASALTCWFIAYEFAYGRRASVQPWVESLRMQATLIGHPARLVDARAFDYAMEGTRGSSLAGVDAFIEDADSTFNDNALIRGVGSWIHEALLRADWDAADARTRLIDNDQSRLEPAFRDGIAGYRALIDAYRTGLIPSLALPNHVGLANLGGILAGIEAVAIGGSQQNANEWQGWAEEAIPEGVKTSLEWPVALDRVRGLLDVRAGSLQSGVTSLRNAVHWADSAGYTVEASLARLQLGELLAHGEVRSRGPNEARELRRTAWAALEVAGLPPAPHAYAATRALALSRDDNATVRLTRREADVLTYLADGMTYKQVGERLGISWRTAQLHATHIYLKLGANTKWQAVDTARELNILS